MYTNLTVQLLYNILLLLLLFAKSEKSMLNDRYTLYNVHLYLLICIIKARGGGGKSFKKPKKILFPKSIHFLTTEILLPLIYL